MRIDHPLKTRSFATATVAAAAIVLAAPTAGIAAGPAVANGVGSSAASPSRATVDPSAIGLITFDVPGAPCTFDLTAPLRDTYAGIGVHFRGATADTGGAILDQCGGFGVDALSGTAFLAFNTGTYATTPERISFDDPQAGVQLNVANGAGTGTSTFTLKARQTNGQVITKIVTTEDSGYVPIRVTSAVGIDRVTLTAQTPDGAFVVDDLAFKSK